MNDRGKPLFLARESYRRRRLIDASRLVPLLGCVFLLTPVLWSAPGSGSLAWRGLYLFAIWGLLVLITQVLARRLAATPDEPGTVPPEAAGEGRNVV